MNTRTGRIDAYEEIQRSREKEEEKKRAGEGDGGMVVVELLTTA